MNMKPIKATMIKKKSEILGKLYIRGVDGKVIMVRVKSGQSGYQYTYWVRGLSPIPPSNEIKGNYSIDVNGYCPGSVSAMGYMFYSIKPDPIRSNKNLGSRSEIGLHLDGGYPGTAGCIGVQGVEEMKKIIDVITDIKKAGYKSIPLEVIYS